MSTSTKETIEVTTDTATEETLSAAYDPTVAENKWYQIWEDEGYFAPKMDSDAEAYSIVIPPPNVTGSLHMGHALTITLEDVLIRWHRMQGHKTLWLPGTDHAGIATQIVVEKDLLKTEGKSRHDLGREKFTERIWEWKEKFGDRITEQLRVMGCSLDWNRQRFTMDEGLSEAVREVFVQLHEEGLIYRAERLVNWCPRCHTALSDLEVDHKEGQKGELWSFAYPLAEGDGEIIVATTRPETMLGDTAIAVHPDDECYAGLVGKFVRHPILGYRIPIVADAVLVDPEFGTGAVKVTPAHDFNDFATGKRHNLPLFNILDTHAKILAEPEVRDQARSSDGPEAPMSAEEILSEIDTKAWAVYAGMDVKESRKKVKEDLAQKGFERDRQDHDMAIGGCQRCETIVEPSLSIQWFVETKPLAGPALEAVRSGETKIIPEQWTKTYYHWMENIEDWCISRQLWWGHRIPAWYCKDCDGAEGEGDYVHFSADAQPMVAREAPEKCTRCGGTNLHQESDVLDTWFSSSLWPFSTLGWPHKTDDLEAFYPNSVLETGFDILFFWVARMMMMGTKFMGKPPFPVIYLHAMVRDKQGDKMSKSKGNVIDPLQLVHGSTAENVNPQFKDEYPEGFPAFGADATRFTLAAMSGSGRDIKLSVERIAGYRAFANKVWNAARFAMMRIEGTPKPLSEMDEHLQPADRFILSRLASASIEMDEALKNYKFAEASQAIYSFLWNEFCDWYIELAKPRLFGDDGQNSKDAASTTLVYVLDQALRMLHPFMPFITEEIWQKLPIERPCKSIMIAPFPRTLADMRNTDIEAEYRLVQDAITGIRTIRSESNVPPSKRVEASILVESEDVRTALQAHQAEIENVARLASFRLGTPGEERSAQSAVKVLERFEVVVSLAGIVDFAKEAERLQKAIDKTTKEHERLVKKLGNEKFIGRAPAEIIAKDRARSEELAGMLSRLNDSLVRAQSAI